MLLTRLNGLFCYYVNKILHFTFYIFLISYLNGYTTTSITHCVEKYNKLWYNMYIYYRRIEDFEDEKT